MLNRKVKVGENTQTIEGLKTQLDDLTQENISLRKSLDDQKKEMDSNERMMVVGESAAMIVHEALNPLTAVIARLQQTLNENSDLELMDIILKEWNKDFHEGGVEQLINSLKETADDGSLMIEEDLQNLVGGLHDNHHNLEFTVQQLKRVVLILDSLRGLARTKSSIEPHNIRDSITMTKALMDLSLQKLQIQFVEKIHHKSMVMVDENEFVQVLHNLVRNAKQAIQKEGIITLSTKEATDRVELRVSDTGSGILKEFVDKIFVSRFTTKDKQSGTGLGLSYSQRVMRKYKGDLVLESPGGNGQGATFLCWLPTNN